VQVAFLILTWYSWVQLRHKAKCFNGHLTCVPGTRLVAISKGIQSNRSMHHYRPRCVSLCFINIRQKGQFWAASLASAAQCQVKTGHCMTLGASLLLLDTPLLSLEAEVVLTSLPSICVMNAAMSPWWNRASPAAHHNKHGVDNCQPTLTVSVHPGLKPEFSFSSTDCQPRLTSSLHWSQDSFSGGRYLPRRGVVIGFMQFF